jgi:hypothetical protein
MRTAILVCVVLLSASACKTRPQPTLPRIPDSNQIGGGGSTELPGATVFHSIYRYTGHAAQAHAFLWLAVMELPDATRIDVFESVPKR